MAKPTTPQPKNVTLQTIADLLGVSRTTVSNAYGKPDQLAPALQEKIFAAAKELGYAGPHPAARTLRSGRSGAVGLLLAESLSYAVNDPAAVLLLQGIAEVFDEAGTSLLLLPALADRRAGARAACEAVVDAFLVYSAAVDNPQLAAIVERRLPIVVIDEPPLPGAARVGVDDVCGAEAMARHLLALGHRAFAAITFPLREDDYRGFADPDRQAAATYPVTAARLGGYASTLRAAGLDWGAVPLYECPVNTQEEGCHAAGLLLDRHPRPTAIVALSDQLALGAIEAAARRGLAVPADLSVAGFDDVPAAATARPALTTVRQPLRAKGVVAARLVLEKWAATEPPDVSLPTELVVRASTGPVPP